jgi:hypothetical protein
MDKAIMNVGGCDYRWVVHRWPKWTSDRWSGLAVLVEPAKSPLRQLIIEFPFIIASRRSTPQRQRPSVSPKRIANYVQQAIAAGWDSKSRGKPFIFSVDEAA